ncbi:cupin-like domain-containing protein [Aureococcus anophagefferens]|nr:cupin-like domain-containing protein [Aureococcus anophagefferens]
MTRPPAQAFDEAAASWRASGGFEAAFSAAAQSVAARRECDLPRYALTAWAAAHGGVLPDHPCVFVAEPATTAAPAFREFRDRGAFLDRYGQVAVHAEPGYTQAGGHLGYFKCAPSRIGCSVKLADLAASWQPNGTRAGLYVSEFSEGPLTDAAWDALRSLAYFSADLASRNFLVGGDRSGLPFHKHAKTWQMLFAGRKVWYLLPPGAWPRALADLVGPYLFPADAWADAVDALPNVAGLLRCEQLPGEILYFPDDWWHATLNDADYSVAYGEKPHRMPVVDGPRAFELFQYDTRPATLLHNATRAWCAQSRCCDAYYTFESSRQRDASGFVLPALWARIKALRDRMLATTAPAVVWVDSDVVFVDAGWCPSFDGGASMVVARDPYPWTSSLNHGFFALRNDAAGRGIAAAHWDAWANVSAAYVAEDGECFGNRTAARWKQCRVGGKYAGQGAFKTYVLPRFRAAIAIVPDKTFQSADAQECDGVVKHFAAGRTAEALRLRTVERCAESYFRAPAGGAAAAPERPRARGGGGRRRRGRAGSTASWSPPSPRRSRRSRRGSSGCASRPRTRGPRAARRRTCLVVANVTKAWDLPGLPAHRTEFVRHFRAHALVWDGDAVATLVGFSATSAVVAPGFGGDGAPRFAPLRVGGRDVGVADAAPLALAECGLLLALAPVGGPLPRFVVVLFRPAAPFDIVAAGAEPMCLPAPGDGACAADAEVTALARGGGDVLVAYTVGGAAAARVSAPLAELVALAGGDGACAANAPRRAIGASGAHVDAFFYLADDDPGSSHGRPSIREARQRVLDVVASFRPKDAYVGPFVADALPDALPAGRPFPKQFRRGYYWPNKRPPWAFQVWWATWEKVRRCFALVEDFERSTLRRRYDFVARLRPDLWFFGAPPPLAAIFRRRRRAASPSPPASSAASGAPRRRTTTSRGRAATPRRSTSASSTRSPPATTSARCSTTAGPGSSGACATGPCPWPPTPLAPYTVARACDGAAPGLAVAVECYRWRVDEARRTASPPLALADLRAAYDAGAARWGERAAPASTCAAIDDAPTYNTWSFPARGDAAA